MERVDFRPYKREQLEAIVHARLKAAAEGLDNDTTVMEPDAIKLAAARVAAVSGDARRVLDVCRYVVMFHFLENPRVSESCLQTSRRGLSCEEGRAGQNEKHIRSDG